MRRSLAGRRHRRPVPIDIPAVDPGADDLTTWSNTAKIETATLPGTLTDRHFAIVDVTKFLTTAAKADIGALRFRRADGVLLGHYRTPSGRIMLACEFHGGKNSIDYFWGKSGATQPGSGFPDALTIMGNLRLGLIFDGNAALDIATNPAAFDTVGTPTITTGINGQAMHFASGSYIKTDALKLRTDARPNRSVFALVRLNNASDLISGRVISWGSWATPNRAFQLWCRPDGLELYVSGEEGNGTIYETWSLLMPPRVGWNTIGGSWRTGTTAAKLVLNDQTITTVPDGTITTPGPIFNSPLPYIVGGTSVNGFYLDGSVECVFELHGDFISENHLKIWSMAWGNPDAFWGIADRTPDNFDVPALLNQPLNSEAAFAKKQITGISDGTPISVNGGGNPTYSIGSTSSVSTDIKAKGSSDGTISNGQWLSSFHTTAGDYSAVTESNVTIGTAQSARKSTTISSPSTPVGGSGIPTGPATVTVSSLSALKTAITNGKGGDIIEILEGDYKSQGAFEFSNKDLRSSSQPMVIRASRRPYRGYLPSEGGLWVSGESSFTSGSGGAEFSGGIRYTNIHNIVFDGIRWYQGATSASNLYNVNMSGCTNVRFQYCKFGGYKPTTPESTWGPYRGTLNPYPNEWSEQSRGVNLGRSLTRCDAIHFYKCIFHYHSLGIDFANTKDCVIEESVITDVGTDNIRSDGGQTNLVIKNNILYRSFPQQGTNVDVSHPDAIQSTSITQNGPVNHTVEGNIVSVGDGAHGKMQQFFFEHDRWPEYYQPYGFKIINNLLIAPSVWAILIRPADRNRIEYTTVIADFHAAQAPDATQIINLTAAKSFGNNVVNRVVYENLEVGAGDTVTQSTKLARNEYETQLVHYPNSYKKSGFTPVRVLNPYTGVLVPQHLGFVAPKASSRIHPNQTGYHMGASQLFEKFGVLP